jgi:DnaK suppressor protein
MTASDGLSASGLTPAELQFLHDRLERLRADLLTRLHHEQSLVSDGEPHAEPMDTAEQTRVQDDAALFVERDRTMLAEIEHALRKFDDGSYGLSEASGEPIGFRRLEAIPWARLATEDMVGMPRPA